MSRSIKIRIVGNAVIIRFDYGEGSVDDIISVNYPRLSESEFVYVKEYIVSPEGANRPDVIV